MYSHRIIYEPFGILPLSAQPRCERLQVLRSRRLPLRFAEREREREREREDGAGKNREKEEKSSSTFSLDLARFLVLLVVIYPPEDMCHEKTKINA